jgi:uncharacterized protein YeaO (DUF488 family)
MSIALKRVYEPPALEDGYRVLVDRLWPRGLSKARIKIDEWLRDAAPSDRLRKSYHTGELDWNEFEKCYLSELERHRDILQCLADRSRKEQITLLFSSKNEEYNNAVVLRQFLKKILGFG